MKLSEKIALNATISATLRSSGRFPHLGISEIAELAKEIIEESESVYSKERELLQQSPECREPVFAQSDPSDPSQKEYWNKWKPHAIE